tara:strand:+ start:1897 stop:2136 length:240 start_codon:yes stop_codon:yes gene_type:complete
MLINCTFNNYTKGYNYSNCSGISHTEEDVAYEMLQIFAIIIMCIMPFILIWICVKCHTFNLRKVYEEKLLSQDFKDQAQ